MADPIDPPAPVGAPAPVDPPPVLPPAAPDPPVDPPEETAEQKITRLEAEVKSARQEAGKARIAAKQTAADEARAELAQTVGKALGLVPGNDPVDPAVLIEQATAAQTVAKQAQVELAVFRAADAAGGDPIALLDSRTFLESAAAIDPTDAPALAAAITEAVTGNPRLGKAPTTPPGMRPNPAQGRPPSQPLGIAAQIAAAETSGDVRESIRLKSIQAATSK